MIEGLSHLTLVVRDLERTGALLRQVFDAEEVYASRAVTFSRAPEKFFLIGGVWVAIMEGDPAPTRRYDHIAFKIADADLETYAARLDAAGVDRLMPRRRVEGEGRSLYFHDFDNHLFELHTGTLHERLARYAKGR